MIIVVFKKDSAKMEEYLNESDLLNPIQLLGCKKLHLFLGTEKSLYECQIVRYAGNMRHR